LIAIIDYAMGNLHSVNKAIEKCGGDTLITSSKEEILKADKVVLPGVGAIGKAKEALIDYGIWEILPQIVESGKPFLGICLGMQMLFDYSEEGEQSIEGLGIIPGAIKMFPKMKNFKVPHMGWNQIQLNQADHPYLKNISNNDYAYFVHSFYAEPKNESDIAVSCNYGFTFTAAVARDNIFASQFHPEKSQAIGLTILKNFVEA